MKKSVVSLVGGYRVVNLSEKDRMRFWSKVEKIASDPGCWIWTGGAFTNGYGAFAVKGVNHKANRVAFVDGGGVLSDEKPQANHLCHNRLCCRPDHMYAGTQDENRNDMLVAERQSRGEKHSKSFKTRARGILSRNAIFTEEDVREIRRLYDHEGWRQQDLINKYGCSKCAIRGVVLRITWQHI